MPPVAWWCWIVRGSQQPNSDRLPLTSYDEAVIKNTVVKTLVQALGLFQFPCTPQIKISALLHCCSNLAAAAVARSAKLQINMAAEAAGAAGTPAAEPLGHYARLQQIEKVGVQPGNAAALCITAART